MPLIIQTIYKRSYVKITSSRYIYQIVLNNNNNNNNNNYNNNNNNNN